MSPWRRFVCWANHQRFWIVLQPGLLPFALDTEAICPRCDTDPGRPVWIAYVYRGAPLC